MYSYYLTGSHQTLNLSISDDHNLKRMYGVCTPMVHDVISKNNDKKSYPRTLDIIGGHGQTKIEVNDVPQNHRENVVIIIGATGTGKSKLSIYLAKCYEAELINSDKMQVYEGLDIVTNKVTQGEQCEIPHHLLGILDPYADFTVEMFCEMALLSIDSILSRGRLPIIVGGSNSYIEALIDSDEYKFRSKYDCCFLWVDVALAEHRSFLSMRIDQMVDNGMVEELRSMFDPDVDYSKGIFRSIGVREFDQYFRTEPYNLENETRKKLFRKGLSEMKENTCQLARRQQGKIHRLKDVKGWNMHRLDATEVFKKVGKEAEEAWKELVAAPSKRIVDEYLKNKLVTITN